MKNESREDRIRQEIQKLLSEQARSKGKEDSTVVFHMLNVKALKLPFQLLKKYEHYLDLLWNTNVTFGYPDLTDEQRAALEKVHLNVVCIQAELPLSEKNLDPHILFVTDRETFTEEIERLACEIGDMEFAVRIRDCMYSDLGMLPDWGFMEG